MRKLLLYCISWYSYLISPLLGSNCRFYPSCSEYAKQAIEQYGVLNGGGMTAKRLSRCHPWHEGGFDPLI